MIRIILEGFMLGLASGIYCAGACLVFFAPYLVAEAGPRQSENLKTILSFMSGRFIAYVIFALIVYLIGAAYKGILTARLANISLVIASLLMLAYSLSRNFRSAKFCDSPTGHFGLMRLPFFLGLFTGLNPCPPFLVGAARIWTLNSMFEGVLLFVAFFLGTSVYMIPFVFVGRLAGSERIKKIGLMTALLCSVWFLFVGISGLMC